MSTLTYRRLVEELSFSELNVEIIKYPLAHLHLLQLELVYNYELPESRNDEMSLHIIPSPRSTDTYTPWNTAVNFGSYEYKY
ncbi:hypothetical protein LOD99_6407 [Oopsacas minuta]|uniref:Uncharacterized protein n=1 Tax=Oopsacas minuta TaxID=111878 RepID=A0AAV7JM32_9METZ|nr:hypothetical protein LOD99_6407 [Oopsacas minuta]